jgi:hypothetical protein
LPVNYLCHNSQGSLTCCKTLRYGPTALFPLRRKSCFGFLSPLKICYPHPGLNPRSLVPVDSTITTRPPRTTDMRVNRNYFPS